MGTLSDIVDSLFGYDANERKFLGIKGRDDTGYIV
jgi:hypothetical protein